MIDKEQSIRCKCECCGCNFTIKFATFVEARNKKTRRYAPGKYCQQCVGKAMAHGKTMNVGQVNW